MKLDPSTRVCFKYAMTSDKLDSTYLITTPLYIEIKGEKELRDYLHAASVTWAKDLNEQFGADDFRIMNAEESEQFFTGEHRHSQNPELGMGYENTSIRH